MLRRRCRPDSPTIGTPCVLASHSPITPGGRVVAVIGTPRAELVHWVFAAGFLLLGLILLAETIVGTDVFAMRRWRLYLWPSIAFAIGVALWPVSVFFTN